MISLKQNDVPVWVAWWGCCSLDEPWRPGWLQRHQKTVWQVKSAPWGDEGCYSPYSWICGGDHREQTQTCVYTNTHAPTQRHNMTDNRHIDTHNQLYRNRHMRSLSSLNLHKYYKFKYLFLSFTGFHPFCQSWQQVMGRTLTLKKNCTNWWRLGS